MLRSVNGGFWFVLFSVRLLCSSHDSLRAKASSAPNKGEQRWRGCVGVTREQATSTRHDGMTQHRGENVRKNARKTVELPMRYNISGEVQQVAACVNCGVRKLRLALKPCSSGVDTPLQLIAAHSSKGMTRQLHARPYTPLASSNTLTD
ncbi:unnamed protein product [Ectocarpus sp. 4 AP-2014]